MTEQAWDKTTIGEQIDPVDRRLFDRFPAAGRPARQAAARQARYW